MDTSTAIFHQRMKIKSIEEVKIAPQSPWQNPYAERLIGSTGASASIM
jgi:hypothetical protein